ncbi:hypothetical protein OV079_25500 [Nannocystis pusilla]|uniref:Uncharacterized protein n=1 Tax=Nannocystis pusilla TaxID=889268 RepID=A0A9X3ES47_9BACT|nr:hypothetical protein [Nannocystis pusilla]MCY1008851.1 hypothetical protein [Nannocystis pusilla]
MQTDVAGAGRLGQVDLVLVEEADVVEGLGAGDAALLEDLLELAEVLGAALAGAEAAAVFGAGAAARVLGGAAVAAGGGEEQERGRGGGRVVTWLLVPVD